MTIKECVKEITVLAQEIKIIYTLPLLPDGLTEESVGVLPIVRYGGRYRTRTCDPLRVKQILALVIHRFCELLVFVVAFPIVAE